MVTFGETKSDFGHLIKYLWTIGPIQTFFQ